MPGFHKHKGDSSYYLIPNFGGDCRTYQVEAIGRDMLLAMGFEDGGTVPQNVFDTLNDLGLLYFKDTDKDPQSTAPTPDAADLEVVGDLSVEQRCTFITRVLDNFPLAEIQSDAFYNVYLSVESADEDDLQPILNRVLENTPFDGDITRLAIEKSENPVLASAAYLHFIYNTLRSDPAAYPDYATNHGGECVIELGDYAFYLVDEDMWHEGDGELDIPTPLGDALQDAYSSRELADFVQTVCEVFGTLFLLNSDSHTARAVASGFDDLDDVSLSILPKDEPSNRGESFQKPDKDGEWSPDEIRVPSVKREFEQ